MDSLQANNTLDYAWDMMHTPGGAHIFLTGNAGTGKSTLMRKFIAANEDKVIVMAPTGIAAVNVGGVTIHRFCHFPIIPINFAAIKWLDPRRPFEAAKLDVIRHAKYLIIDEISMVRADIMDQIEWFFRKNFPKGEPFAGLKLIMVGDIDQLPPVLADDEQKKMIQARYKSEFFFHAKCWTQNEFRTISLNHVFRQSDPTFVNLLNDIKNNRLAPFDLQRLNDRCVRTSDEALSPKDGVMLCSTNAIANEVNAEMLNRIDSPLIKLEGVMSGEFDKKNCPVEPIIFLKEGARVMTVRNFTDEEFPARNFQNGSIGEFIGFAEQEAKEDGPPQDQWGPPEDWGPEPEKKTIRVLVVKLDNGFEVFVAPVMFESIDYVYDEKADKITHKVTGTFSQYPIKIAYALTIHKSQGATFEKVIIDLGEKGAFAHGQTYVALSRCTSLEGLILRRAIRKKDLIYHKSVLDFHRDGPEPMKEKIEPTKPGFVKHVSEDNEDLPFKI